jgi:hypothetical protein
LDLNDLELLLADLSHRNLVMLGRLAGARYSSLVSTRSLRHDPSDIPANVLSALDRVSSDPVIGLDGGDRPQVGSDIRRWLDRFDEEPEGTLYWPYQAMVIAEYIAQLDIADDPSQVLIRLARYCLDLAYFLDQELDQPDGEARDREYRYWLEMARAIPSEPVAELVHRSRRDGDRVAALIERDEQRMTD